MSDASMEAPRAGRLEDVLVRHATDLDRLVCHYVSDETDRDDLRQDIAVALWRAMPAFKGEAAERTYVLHVARNRAITFCVRRAQRQALFIELSDALPASFDADAMQCYGALRARVRTQVQALPPVQRTAMVLTVLGWSPGEIASLLNKSAVSIRVALHRARATLKTAMIDGEPA